MGTRRHSRIGAGDRRDDRMEGTGARQVTMTSKDANYRTLCSTLDSEPVAPRRSPDPRGPRLQAQRRSARASYASKDQSQPDGQAAARAKDEACPRRLLGHVRANRLPSHFMARSRSPLSKFVLSLSRDL